MPTYEVTSPEGVVFDVTAPEGASEAEVISYAQSNFPQQETQEAIEPVSLGQKAGNVWEGIKQGATFGLGEEAQAAIAAGVARPFIEQPYGELYGQALGELRGELSQAREESPYLTGGGELAGAMLTGGAAAAKLLPQGARAYVATRPIRGAAGLGALSGGIYGYGTGEGGAAQRGAQAGEYGLYGAGGGVFGALLGRAKNILSRKKATRELKTAGQDVIQEVAERGEDIVPVEGGEAAYGKVAKALKRDLGADYDDVLSAYKSGDASLAELNQSRTRTLAQGAAQYSGGKAEAQKFFDPKVAGSYERVMKNIRENVSGVDSYHTTADDLLAAGRAKAAPLYDEAYEAVISDVNVLKTPEIQGALSRAYKQYPTELLDANPDSIKALDYAKRVLDDDISKAQRAGESNFARSRIDIKNTLLSTMDDASPAYKKAREQAGDYLSINNAMEQGRKALKTDSELLAKQFKSLPDAEKQAYQIGLGKAIRDEVGKVAEGANPYRRILGSPEKQKRISSALSPRQYKRLESGLKAEDRLFKIRNEILGGSPTAGKQEAKNLIATTTQGVDDIMQIPRKTMVGALQKFRLGLNDKTASKVSEILYETDPIKKLDILDKLKASKDFTPQEAKIVKQVYFDAADKFDVLRARGAIGGGALPAIIGEE
jgi:hypothetical protein